MYLQCRRPWFNSWVRKICYRRDRLPTPIFLGFPCGSAGKESASNAGDLGSIPGLGRSPGEGKGYPLQYSSLEYSVDCIVHGITKSWTRLSDSLFTFILGYKRHLWIIQATVYFSCSCHFGHPSDDGQEFNGERKLKLAWAKIRFGHSFICLFIYSFTSGLTFVSVSRVHIPTMLKGLPMLSANGEQKTIQQFV